MLTPAQESKRRARKERRHEGRGNQGWWEAKGGKCKGMGRNMRRAGEGTSRGREERGVSAVPHRAIAMHRPSDTFDTC